ncbi:heparan sulfate 2-O-sulfotransferase pipe isoform X1 [Haematobia irritans]|uniref:heparan sulfate 2-O-sulfotransferase pipe isoform X1 n=1 Tax=Haematobia irritans TaxID=7368 RepID=UPI003F5037A8
MSLLGEKNFKMKMRDVETAFKYRRFPYPKRSVELIALLAISCTFFLFMHTNKLNSRLKEMEMKLQPSEFSALGLTGNNHLDGPKHEDTNTLHGTYQYLKSTGQRLPNEGVAELPKQFGQLQKPQNHMNRNRNRNWNWNKNRRNRRQNSTGGKRLKPVFGGEENKPNQKSGGHHQKKHHKRNNLYDDEDEYDDEDYYDDEDDGDYDEDEDEEDNENDDKHKKGHKKTKPKSDEEKTHKTKDDKDKSTNLKIQKNETETIKDDTHKNENKFNHRITDNDSHEDTDDDDYDDDYENSLYSSDALNNTKKAEVDVVFFNRVPKVGSQSLMELMVRLGKAHNYVHSRDQGKPHETIFLKPPQQKAFINELYRQSRPRVYSQHIAYINFTQHHQPRPIYINLVRDPIERIRSWHYYVRAEWYYRDLQAKLGDKAPKMPPKEFMEMDLDTCVRTGDIHCQFNQMEIKNPAGDHRRQTLFFCGQNRKLCMPFNSKAAMQKAKRTVEQDYAVVGTWEDTNITLSVLEHYIPRFFGNAKAIYYEGKDRLSSVNKNNVTRPISEETRMILSRNLTHEIEFYEFCKQRLYLQYNAITDGKSIDDDNYVLIPDSEEDDSEEEEN